MKHANGPPTLYRPSIAPSVVASHPIATQPTHPSHPTDGKILDSTSFDFSTTAIIKPPFEEAKNAQVGNMYTRVVIDSRDRDLILYPNPNKYVINLETDVLEVTTGEVIIKDIPMSMYLINVYNNTFTVILSSGTRIDAVLPQGNYTPTTMRTTLETVMGPNFSVLYDSFADKFIVQSNVSEFTISFEENKDLSLILGFNVVNTSVNKTIVAPFRVNFAVNKYIVMRIGQFTINNSSNPVLHKSTALISDTDVKILRSIQPIKKYFNPPIARLVKLDISFTDYYGNPYDFQNQDHRLEVMLESRKNLTKYTSFV